MHTLAKAIRLCAALLVLLAGATWAGQALPARDLTLALRQVVQDRDDGAIGCVWQ